MTFHIPVRVRVRWVILFIAADFDLLETPLR